MTSFDRLLFMSCCSIPICCVDVLCPIVVGVRPSAPVLKNEEGLPAQNVPCAACVCVCVCNMLSFMTMFLFDQYLKPGSRHRQTITPTSKEMSKASGPESA